MAGLRSTMDDLRAHFIPLVPRTAGGEELLRRLQSLPGTDERLSAEWELAVFGWLRNRAVSVEPGPAPGSWTRSPDFLVQTIDGRRVHVECVLVRPSPLAKGERARIKQLKLRLDKIPSNGCAIKPCLPLIRPDDPALVATSRAGQGLDTQDEKCRRGSKLQLS